MYLLTKKQVLVKNYIIAIVLILIVYSFSFQTYASETSRILKINVGENGEACYTANNKNDNTIMISRGESVTTQISIKNKAKNVKLKLSILPEKADSMWAGTNINVASNDGNIFSGTMNEFKNAAYTVNNNSALYITITPPRSIPSTQTSYKIHYKISKVKNSETESSVGIDTIYKLNKSFDVLVKVGIALCVILLVIIIIMRFKKRKKINYFKTKFTCLLILIIGLTLTIIGIQVNVMKNNSMGSSIKKDAVIISKQCNTDELKKGDIVLYRTQQGNFSVIGKIEKSDGSTFQIKDNEGENGDVDVQSSSIEGKYLFNIPKIGRIATMISDNLFSR